MPPFLVWQESLCHASVFLSTAFWLPTLNEYPWGGVMLEAKTYVFIGNPVLTIEPKDVLPKMASLFVTPLGNPSGLLEGLMSLASRDVPGIDPVVLLTRRILLTLMRFVKKKHPPLCPVSQKHVRPRNTDPDLGRSSVKEARFRFCFAWPGEA